MNYDTCRFPCSMKYYLFDRFIHSHMHTHTCSHSSNAYIQYALFTWYNINLIPSIGSNVHCNKFLTTYRFTILRRIYKLSIVPSSRLCLRSLPFIFHFLFYKPPLIQLLLLLLLSFLEFFLFSVFPAKIKKQKKCCKRETLEVIIFFMILV